MQYRLNSQPVDEDLVQRLREKEACEMAAYPHSGSDSVLGTLAAVRQYLGTRLLSAARWVAFIAAAIGLVAAVLIATTPAAWPL